MTYSRRLPGLLALCCSLAISALSVSAADDAAGSWTLTPSYVSQYMFRGVRLAGSSFQPGIEYGRGGLAGGLWGSCPLQREGSGSVNWELDLYGSFTQPLVPERLDLVAGGTVYTYPNSHRGEGAYPVTVEPSLALNATVAGVRLTPKIYYDLVLEGPTAELSAAYALPLKDLGTELDFTASVGTFKLDTVVTGSDPKTKNWGDYWLVGVSAPVQVTANAKIVLGLTYTEGRNNYYKMGGTPRERNEAAVGRLFATVSCSISL
jgi:uncharacterized protein (TIGR02001 family)